MRRLRLFPTGLLVCALLSAPLAGAVKRFVFPTPEQTERELLDLINRDRQRLGRKPLLPDPLLQEIARAHSAKMAAEGKLSHYFPAWPDPGQKLSQAGAYFLRNSENIAHGQTPFAGFIHESLMASPLHRVNILDEGMLQAGIGVVKNGNDFYVSEEFAAIIDCPNAGETAAFIENDLRRWYLEEFGQGLAPVADAGLWARVSAQQNLIDNPIVPAPLNAPKVQVIGVKFNDLGIILAELKKEIRQHRARSLAVGAAWGRTLGFPGGTYSVTLLLFE